MSGFILELDNRCVLYHSFAFGGFFFILFFNTVIYINQVKLKQVPHTLSHHWKIPFQLKQRKTNIHCQRQLCIVISNYISSSRVEGSQFMSSRIPCNGMVPSFEVQEKTILKLQYCHNASELMRHLLMKILGKSAVNFVWIYFSAFIC